jgi:hypothetical protein
VRKGLVQKISGILGHLLIDSGSEITLSHFTHYAKRIIYRKELDEPHTSTQVVDDI